MAEVIIMLFKINLLAIAITCCVSVVGLVLEAVKYFSKAINIKNQKFMEDDLDIRVKISLDILICLFAFFGLLVMLTIYFYGEMI